MFGPNVKKEPCAFCCSKPRNLARPALSFRRVTADGDGSGVSAELYPAKTGICGHHFIREEDEERSTVYEVRRADAARE